jgi:hypothetical protein
VTLYLLRLLALSILLVVFGRSIADGIVEAVYKNAAEPLDKELPVTVTAFRSSGTIVSEIGGRGEGLNCSMPWGIDYFFLPNHGIRASDFSPRQGDAADNIRVRRTIQQAAFRFGSGFAKPACSTTCATGMVSLRTATARMTATSCCKSTRFASAYGRAVASDA